MALPEPRQGGTALITGASAGIGSAIARELALRGHGVTLVARRAERLRELADELVEGQGVRAEVLACDLERGEDRDRLGADLERLGLEVDVLVNNAGFGYTGDLVHADRARQVAMVELNCVAVVDLTARYLPGMTRRGHGAVINVASTAAFQPLPKTATYGATKAFVLSFSEAIHSELKGSGVVVTAVCPGPVRTEFAQVAGVGDSEEKLPDLFWMSPVQVARAAIEAAEGGKRSIVTGKLNLAGSVVGRHAPRALSLPVAKRIWSRAE